MKTTEISKHHSPVQSKTRLASRSVMAFLMGGLCVLSLLLWYITPETIPHQIKITTGEQKGLYHQIGKLMSKVWEQQIGGNFELLLSEGTMENYEALLNGKADLAILQSGVVDLQQMSIIAPLYQEVVHIVVRENSGVRKMSELKGKSILVGTAGSGMHKSALKVLGYHGLNETNTTLIKAYFMDIEKDSEVDGFIATTGIMNKELNKLLATGGYRLIPIDYAEALSMKNAFFSKVTIPKGLYQMGDSFMQHDCQTVANMALLVGRADLQPMIIDEILRLLFRNDHWSELPFLLDIEEVRNIKGLRLCSRAMQFFHPSDRIGHMANIMESLAALKELAVAFAAGLYLLWDRWRRQNEKNAANQMSLEKEKLDAFLAQTLEVERKQTETRNVEALNEMLNQVIQIKLMALEELTHEELRGDRVFLIFLTQCSNLINTLQQKINHHDASGT